jgi:hypothetical protein
MKPTITVVLLLILGLTLQAQVQLEHTYNFSGTSTKLSDGEMKYYVMDVPLEECRIYNTDHSLYKTIPLPVPEGYFLYDLKFVSKNTFNSDDQIELLYIYYKVQLINSQSVYTYGMKVINEAGTNLMSLDNGAIAEIQEVDGELKLLAYQYIWNDSYYLVYTHIYSLGGTTQAAVQEMNSPLKLYPNPVSEVLHIELDEALTSQAGVIRLSDMSGKEILNEALLPGDLHHSIETGQLVPGTYIINVGTREGVRVAGKIAKK